MRLAIINGGGSHQLYYNGSQWRLAVSGELCNHQSWRQCGEALAARRRELGIKSLGVESQYGIRMAGWLAASSVGNGWRKYRNVAKAGVKMFSWRQPGVTMVISEVNTGISGNL